MSLRTYGNKRDASEPAIVKALEAMGCSVVRLDKPLDLIIGFRGLSFLAEVKVPGKNLSASQREFVDAWRGNVVPVLRDADDAIDFVNSISLREAA